MITWFCKMIFSFTFYIGIPKWSESKVKNFPQIYLFSRPIIRDHLLILCTSALHVKYVAKYCCCLIHCQAVPRIFCSLHFALHFALSSYSEDWDFVSQGQRRPKAGKAYTGSSGQSTVVGCSQCEKWKKKLEPWKTMKAHLEPWKTNS